jgi:hypothetical protein
VGPLLPQVDSFQPIDQYPKGRLLINDDEYLAVIKDMFNLSLVRRCCRRLAAALLLAVAWRRRC